MQIVAEAAELKAKLQDAEACLSAAQAEKTELAGKAGEAAAQVSRLQAGYYITKHASHDM